MLVEEQYAPILRSDATVLLRPRTGLQDMTLEVDPGRKGAPLEEGATIPLAQTKPNVQPDQILASLDGDTRAYLKLLIQGGAEGLGGRGKALSAGLRRFEPLGRYLAQIGNALVERRRNIARVITSFRALGDELGKADTRLSEWVSAQNAALGAFANQEASIRETLRELPIRRSTATREALASGETLANELGPASEALIPAAQAFAPAQRSLRAFFDRTEEPISRPDPALHPRGPQAGQAPQAGLGAARRRRPRGWPASFSDLNRLFNAFAYNPPGADEGYLFWLAWLNHNTNGALQFEDANGPLAPRQRAAVVQHRLPRRQPDRVAALPAHRSGAHQRAPVDSDLRDRPAPDPAKSPDRPMTFRALHPTRAEVR